MNSALKFLFSLRHLRCSEMSISPLFRWPNSVCHYIPAWLAVWHSYHNNRSIASGFLFSGVNRYADNLRYPE
ncbi:hypothetical protein E4R31_21790 [Salmonella enterica]|nr:hypothetical protein [Salmonella enterica]